MHIPVSFTLALSSVALSGLIGGYVRFLLYPIVKEALILTAQRHSSLRLNEQLERGTIQLDSPQYWAAIEAIDLDSDRP